MEILLISVGNERFPIIRPLDGLYEVMKSMGYVNKVQGNPDPSKVSFPEFVSGADFSTGIPYLNSSAREVYTNLREDGFYDTDVDHDDGFNRLTDSEIESLEWYNS